jgi:hypothetical protein
MPDNLNTSTPQTRKRRPGQRMTAPERAQAQEKFLKSFSMTANVRAACMAAGIDRTLVYQWAEHSEEFSIRFKQAELDANDLIRGELFRRAVQGVEKPMVSMGKVVYVEDPKKKGEQIPLMERVYSDSLLSLLAKARMPEFREKQQIEVNGTLTIKTEWGGGALTEESEVQHGSIS